MYALTNHSADEFIIIIFPRTFTQFTRMYLINSLKKTV